MTKESPWFKFEVNKWLTGDIHLKSYSIKGVFADLCAYYWSKHGDVDFNKCAQKFPKKALESLQNDDIIAVESGKIVIKFLDEQLILRGKNSKTNSKNGSIGGIESGKSRSYKKGNEANASGQGSNIDKNESKRESEKESEILDQEPNFFRINDQLYRGAPSKYFIQNFGTYHEHCVRTSGAENCAAAVKKMDNDYFGYSFNDVNHIRNTFKSCLDRVLKETTKIYTGHGAKTGKADKMLDAVAESARQLGLNQPLQDQNPHE